MSAVAILDFISLLAAGLLAGEEVAVRYGIRGPLAQLATSAHIELRQNLIRTLRILVPSIFAVALFTGAAATALAGPSDRGFVVRCAGLVALVAFIALTLTSTVPINQAVLRWDRESPPEGWRQLIRRWEQLDTARTWLALLAFGCFAWAALA
jgi:uncharacterized membrane protein